jgi:small conductance mechanosensitive channel
MPGIPLLPDLPANLFVLSYLLDSAYAILLLIGGWLLTTWAAQMVRRRLERVRRMDPTLRPIIVNFVRYVVFGVVAVAALAKFGIQTASVLAVLGAAGLAIALSLQGALSNVASGIMLLVLRPFGVGDSIDLEGVSASVREIGLFATEFETYDGIYVLVPNTQLFSRSMKNFSRLPYRRVDVKVGISYSDDIDKALGVAMSILKGDQRVLSHIPPQAVVENLGASSVNLVLRCWTEAAKYGELLSDLQRKVKLRFDAEGITIPFPQQEIRIVGRNGQASGSAA